jgi:hypothetical protein
VKRAGPKNVSTPVSSNLDSIWRRSRVATRL